MQIYDQEEASIITKNKLASSIKEEAIKCVPYAYIFMNHYRIRKYIEDNKLTESALDKIIIPFEVEILDHQHPHVEYEDETSNVVYKKMLNSYRNSKLLEFRHNDTIFLSLKELRDIVFNKSCSKKINTRLLSDTRAEANSSEVILALLSDKTAEVIKNSSDLDFISKGVYAETIYKLRYIGKDENKPEWLYEYRNNPAGLMLMKNDCYNLISSFQRVISKKKVNGLMDLIDDSYRSRR